MAAWGCLECPNAVFTERHLPSLTAFAAFLEDQRGELVVQDGHVPRRRLRDSARDTTQSLSYQELHACCP